MFRYLAIVSLFFTLIEGGQRWHTSQVGLMQLYNLQKEHFNVINEYLNLESERLNKLKNNLDTIDEWLDKKLTSIDTRMHNHVRALQMVTQIPQRLSAIENYTNNKKSLEVLEKIDEHKDLSGDHLILAYHAIRRLQRFYAIPSSDMVKGRYNGRIIGDVMNACDTYVMSKHCFEDGDMYGALEWSIQTYNKWTDGDRPDCVDIENVIHYIVSSSTNTGFNLSTLFDLKTLHFEESTDNFVKFYSLMKDELFDPIDCVILENIKPYDAFEAFESATQFKELCRNGKSSRTLTEYSKCRYQNKNSAYRMLMPFKEEDVNSDPYVKIYHDVLYDEEIKKIISMAKDELIDAKIKSFGGTSINKEGSRLGQVSWFNEEQGTKEFASLNARIASFTGMSIKTAENYQIVNYGLGGHYIPHNDAFDRGLQETKTNGNRLATVLFYLTDIPNDGFTTFPLLDIVSPVEKGAALFWYNLHLSNGSTHFLTNHGSCPLVKGNKWIMTKWLYEEGHNLPYNWRDL